MLSRKRLENACLRIFAVPKDLYLPFVPRPMAMFTLPVALVSMIVAWNR